jgi:CCR4-NOT transcription complex subunit 6
LLTAIQSTANPNQVPTIITGDFNSKPNSGVYTFMKTGKIPAKYTDEDFPDLVYTDKEVTHKLDLKSAYATGGKEPEFTVFTNQIKETVYVLQFL